LLYTIELLKNYSCATSALFWLFKRRYTTESSLLVFMNVKEGASHERVTI